jgi:hypothetical protein
MSNILHAAALSIGSTSLSLPPGSTKVFTIKGGRRPYNVSTPAGTIKFISGTSYSYTAPLVNGVVITNIIIKHQVKTSLKVPVEIYPKLFLANSTADLTPGSSYTIKASGGVLPYRYIIGSGNGGKMSGAIYTAPISAVSGVTNVSVLDARNQQATMAFTITAGTCIYPGTTNIAVSNSTYTYYTQSSGSAAECAASKKISTCMGTTGTYVPAIPGNGIYSICSVLDNPQITSFTSSADTFVSGQSLDLSWASSNATKLQLDPGAIIVTGKTSYNIKPSAETTYVLTATNTAGTSSKSIVIKAAKTLTGDYVREPYADGCVPRANTDYMESVPWQKRIEPRDCANVLVSTPVFVWSYPEDLVENGIMNFTLKRSSDGVVIHTASTSVPRLLLPQSKALTAGLYEWSISYVNYSKVTITGQVRRLGIPKSNQFAVPTGEQVKNLVLAKSHPRILPAGSNFASIASLAKNGEYGPSFQAYLSMAESFKSQAIIPEPIFRTTFKDSVDESNWARGVESDSYNETTALETLGMAYYFTNKAEYRTKSIERLVALAKWSTSGATSEINQDQANRRIFMVLGLGLDLFYNDLTTAQRGIVVKSVKERLAQIIPKFSSLDTVPLDSHLLVAVQYTLQALMYVAGTPGFEAETEKLASTWETLVTIAGTWGGGTDGGLGNGTAYGWYDTTSAIVTVANIKLITGINMTKFPPLGNLGFNQIAQTPAAGKQLGQFGDDTETTNQYFDYSRNEFRLYASVSGKPEYEWYWRAHPGNLTLAAPVEVQNYLMLGISVPVAPLVTPQLPNSFLFEQAGYTALHSDTTDTLRSSVFFRSSYLGSLNHSHADNNGFTFVSKGKELLISGGYYPYYDSPHHALIGRATRYKNALTFDGGIGQSEPVDNPKVPGKPVYSMEPSGKLINFKDNGVWAVTTGDATLAYRGRNPVTEIWKPLLTNAIRTVAYNREQGIVIIYDWATSAVDRKWELNFQTLTAPILLEEKKTIQIQNGDVRACVDYHGRNGTFSFTKNFPVAPEVARPDQYQARLTADIASKEFVSITVIREDCRSAPIVEFVSNTQMLVAINEETIGFNKKTVQFGE